MKKHLRDLLVLSAIIGITLWFMLKDGQTAHIPAAMENTKAFWVLLSLVCMAGVLFIDGWLIKELSGIVNVATSWSSAVRYAMIGQYFNLVTPLSSGSQPAMVLDMTHKGNFTSAESTSVVMAKYVLYQITVTLYAILLLMAAFGSIMSNAHSAIWYALIGIVLHSSIVLFMYLAVRNSQVLHRVIYFFCGILKRIGFRGLDHRKAKAYADELAADIKELARNPGLLIKAWLLTFLQITLYFSIGYCLYLAFDLNEYSYLEIMAVQALLYMAVSFVPTPGNAGASEGAIYFLFGMFFPEGIIIAYVLLWRCIVFYLSLLVSGCFTLYDYLCIKPVK